MQTPQDCNGVPHHHLVGVGAGPSNLSLAALAEETVPGGMVLYEREPRPGWHPGLLWPEARLQTSWIKDLVSLIDPRNRFSFLNYLVSSGRIYAFLNAQYEAIPRLEYAHYLAWASRELGTVRYGVDITEIDFTDRFVLRAGERAVATADHLVLGLGTRPHIPECFRGWDTTGSAGVVLAEHLERHLATAATSVHDQVIVVGGGQTGAECVLTLVRRRFRDIRWLGRRHWFAPLDDSPPANDFYRPAYQRFFQWLPEQTRGRYVQEQVLTSDGVSNATLQDLYRSNYEAFLAEGRFPVMMLPGRDVVQAVATGREVQLWCDRASGGRERHTAQLVVLATGREPSPLPLAPGLLEAMETDADGEPRIEHDYSIRWKHDPQHRIFAHNRGRLIHGTADPNLSLLAVRSAVIINSLLEREVYRIRDDQVWTMWA